LRSSGYLLKPRDKNEIRKIPKGKEKGKREEKREKEGGEEEIGKGKHASKTICLLSSSRLVHLH
jgi:hypothetical protein